MGKDTTRKAKRKKKGGKDKKKDGKQGGGQGDKGKTSGDKVKGVTAVMPAAGKGGKKYVPAKGLFQKSICILVPDVVDDCRCYVEVLFQLRAQ